MRIVKESRTTLIFLGISINSNDDFKIVPKNPIYEDSIKILTAKERQELAEIIETLKKNPFLCKAQAI